MSEKIHRRPVEVPAPGAPSDWHWFRRKRGVSAAPGDVALCGYVLGDRIDSLDPAGTGSGRATWCPLCNELVAFVRDGLFPDA